MDNPKQNEDLILDAFNEGTGAFNIGRNGEGRWQVSTRDNKSDGWSIYHGYDLVDTMRRAATKGPQMPTRRIRVIEATALQLFLD